MWLLLQILYTKLYHVCRFYYAPYQLFKSYGIKGPAPIPFFGNYREEAKMVRQLVLILAMQLGVTTIYQVEVQFPSE